MLTVICMAKSIQGPPFNVLKNLQWYFFALVVLSIIVNLLKAQRKLTGHKRTSSQLPQEEYNENLIPCPDCKGKVSVNAVSCPHCGAPISTKYANSIKSKREKTKRVSVNKAVSKFILFSNFFGIVGGVFGLILVIKLASGWLMWILVVFIGLLLIAGVVDSIKLHDKGKFGEQIVHTILSNGLTKETYQILDDVFLPIGESGTTQIDHIVVSVHGVFVIETKNYSGLIFAEANNPKWMQVLGKTKNQFQNPIRQNYLHIRAIADNLGIPEEYIHGIVAFSDYAEFKTFMPEGVVFFGQVPAAIKAFEAEIFRQDQVKEIVKVIREWDASVTLEQRRNHVKNIMERIKQGMPA